MNVNVALDADRRRDLEFYSGDDTEIVLTVYQNDGDEDPLEVSDPKIVYSWGDSTASVGPSFKASYRQREPYSIVGSISGARTTLAYGLLIRKWLDFGCPDDGQFQPLYVRNEVSGGVASSYFEGPGLDGGGA